MGTVEVGLLHLFPQQQVIVGLFHVDGGHRLSQMLEGPFVKDLLGEGMLGPIGIEHRSRRRSSSVLPDSCVILSMVLMALT